MSPDQKHKRPCVKQVMLIICLCQCLNSHSAGRQKVTIEFMAKMLDPKLNGSVNLEQHRVLISIAANGACLA